ncbi:hypothetical protein TSAR_008111 [Trichomalopsis sarcophagae]|uniref:Uncharacterized protein n=1 Tax=Trichomalopsis sarcophagae TaxID=543379 RepID=A0A232EU91_9HYME|nr:hypothetical protein TSAR_008111 [Trichomalopsis sarcophagae]
MAKNATNLLDSPNILCRFIREVCDDVTLIVKTTIAISPRTPTMMSTEMTMIILQCILGDKIKIIKYCLDNLNEPRLLRHFFWEGTNLVHLAVESGSVKAVETILSREINDINATDGNGQKCAFNRLRNK